jgi:ADP-ribose pyrophosphatase
MKQSIAGIIVADGKFLIGHRLPVGEMGGRWEFPGGKVDEGETPHEAILREFREEMGIDVEPLDFITSVEFRNKNGPVQLLAYHVGIPRDADIVLTEHSKLAWATMAEIEKLDFVDSDRLLFSAVNAWFGTKK